MYQYTDKNRNTSLDALNVFVHLMAFLMRVLFTYLFICNVGSFSPPQQQGECEGHRLSEAGPSK